MTEELLKHKAIVLLLIQYMEYTNINIEDKEGEMGVKSLYLVVAQKRYDELIKFLQEQCDRYTDTNEKIAALHQHRKDLDTKVFLTEIRNEIYAHLAGTEEGSAQRLVRKSGTA